MQEPLPEGDRAPSAEESEIADVAIVIPADVAEWVAQQVENAGGVIVVTTEGRPESGHGAHTPAPVGGSDGR